MRTDTAGTRQRDVEATQWCERTHRDSRERKGRTQGDVAEGHMEGTACNDVSSCCAPGVSGNGGSSL